MNLREKITLLIALAALSAHASLIVPTDITIPPTVSGSGNGTLDWRLFTSSGGEIGNAGKTFNFDNANNTLPQGGGADINWFAESFLTSAADLKSYYRLNFPTLLGVPGEIQIVLFFDFNETGAAAQATNHLKKLELILNPTSIAGNPVNPYLNDVQGGGSQNTVGSQTYINQTNSGGTVIATLDPSIALPYNMALVEQGAGHADYIVFTGVDPFKLADSDKVLINLSIDKLNNGAEEVYLSGTYSSKDYGVIPEPATITLISLSGILSLFISRLRSRRA